MVDSSEELRPLPENYSQGGHNLVLKEKNEYYVIYRADDCEYYEVFEYKIANATTIKVGGKITDVPRRERLPGNESFGLWAWACSNEKSVQSAIDRIMERVKNRNEQSN